MNSVDVTNTLTQLQNQTNRISYEQGQKNMGSSKIGKDAFMQLLLTQLKYQDPINPVDDKEFISQQAAFTQIEKLDDINSTLSNSNYISQASSLVGKTVDIKNDQGQLVNGKVESIEFGKDGIGLRIAGNIYTTGQITKIYADSN